MTRAKSEKFFLAVGWRRVGLRPTKLPRVAKTKAHVEFTTLCHVVARHPIRHFLPVNLCPSHAGANSARVCSYFRTLTELTLLGEKGWPGSEGAWPYQHKRVTRLGGPTFCFQVNGTQPHFVRKCKKSWLIGLAQGSSGRLMTLLPSTTFLHINRALISSPDDITGSWPFLQQRFPWYSHQVLFPLAPPYLFHINMTASY